MARLEGIGSAISRVAPPASAKSAAIQTDTNEETPLDALGKKLAGAFSIVTAVLAFVGAKEAGLDRILRNEPGPSLLFFSLVGLGIAAGIMLPVVDRRREVKLRVLLTSLFALGLVYVVLLLRQKWTTAPIIIADVVLLTVVCVLPLLFPSVVWVSLKAAILAVAIIAFLLGIYGTFKLAVLSKSTKDRPDVSASIDYIDGRIVLKGHVGAAGLTNKEHILIRVEGVRDVDDKLYFADGKAGRTSKPPAQPEDVSCFFKDAARQERSDRCQLLFGQRVGPQDTGTVNFDFNVPLTPGLYPRLNVIATVTGTDSSARGTCNQATGKQACTSILMPQGTAHPSIGASWTANPDYMTLSLGLKMGDLNVDDVVYMWAVGRNSAGEVIGAGIFGANASGIIDTTMPVVVSPGIAEVCVRAEVVRGGPLRSPTVQPESTWCNPIPLTGSSLMLRVPILTAK
jgi:hypothetical protein